MNAASPARRLLLATLAAAGLIASAPARAGDITFWTWRQEDRAAYTELFKDFTAANPGINVKIEAFEAANYNTIVSTALAGGKGGDVLQARAYGGLELVAKSGYYLPLDTTNVPELANIPPAALAAETLRADGRVYAVPFASQTLGLLVNKEVFAKAGVTPPTTWAEVATAGAALKAKGVTLIANGTATPWMDEIFAAIFTNPMLGPDFVADLQTGKASFSDPRYVAALTKLLDIRAQLPDGFTGVDYATGQQLFLSGRAAIFAGGSFEIANFRKQNPKLDLDFIAPPAPTAGAPQYVTRFFDGGYAVNAKSPNQADALKLVRYMATPAYGNKFASLLGNISPIKGVVITDPLLAKVSALGDTSMPYITLAMFRFESPTGSELMSNAVQKMMGGTETPQQVGDEVTTGLAKWYKPFQKN